MKKKIVAQAKKSLHGGLANQMMAFMGLLMLADQQNASLMLPMWRTNYPLQKLTLADTYEVWGDIAWPHNFPPVIARQKFDLSKAIVVDGWNVPRHKSRFIVPLYTDIFVPRPELQEHVDNFIDRYGTSYGALHARVERDMRGHPQFGPTVISLDEILNILHNSMLKKVDTLFVAVGDDVLPDDQETLERGVTPWGGRLVRRRDMNLEELTYLDSSIIDMAICTRAQYFVGFPRSTFSIMVHHKRGHLHAPAFSFYYGNNTLLTKK